MYKILKTLKDTYITDRVIKGVRSHNANVGLAGSLDLFKLYGATRSGSNDNNELSRLLLQFDYTNLRNDVATGAVNMNSSNFKCFLNLKSVHGGQTHPSNFKIVIHPLSKSFDEGTGRDVVFYQDRDIANFLTASSNSTWNVSGANGVGTLGASNIDIISSGNLNDGYGLSALWVTQSFPLGTEDLNVDITRIVSGTIAGLIPDNGFRISFVQEQENDQQTRFVKRFASGDAYNKELHPKIIIKYDDSIANNIGNFVFDNSGSVFFYNKVRGSLKNITSGSSTLTGTNCLLLKLQTTLTGAGTYTQYVTASQYNNGVGYVTGTYYATFSVPSTQNVIKQALIVSGSTLTFDQIWSSLDNSVSFYSGTLDVSLPKSNNENYGPTRYRVTATNVFSNYTVTDKVRIRVFIENVDIPYSKVVRTFLETPPAFPETVHFLIRNSVSEEIVIPYDTTYNSTKLSADSKSMFFDLDMSNFYEGNLYEIDIMIVENGNQTFYRNVSAPFKIDQIATT